MKAQDLYPFKINSYCRKLAEKSAPVRAMYYPDERELDFFPGTHSDGLAEKSQSPLPRLIRRYRDRAVILTTGDCFVHCRFCFRKRLWKTNSSDAISAPLSDDELKDIAGFLAANPEIDDILLSGGDVLTLPDDKIIRIIQSLQNTGTVKIIRICSRAPAVAPERITPVLAEKLAGFEGLWVVTHFDHPDELTTEARRACRTLIRNGIPVLDQTVLLKGINDDVETLRKLFKTLTGWGVKVHYLFQLDPVEGVSHFAVPVEKGLDIMDEFRATLSSLAIPFYTIDLPEGGGKINLSRNTWSPDGKYFSPILKKIIRHPFGGKLPYSETDDGSKQS